MTGVRLIVILAMELLARNHAVDRDMQAADTTVPFRRHD
jgi:hypothetical protein